MQAWLATQVKSVSSSVASISPLYALSYTTEAWLQLAICSCGSASESLQLGMCNWESAAVACNWGSATEYLQLGSAAGEPAVAVD